MSRSELRWLLIAAMLVALTLRLYRLGNESFWYDETVSVYLAQQQPAQLIAHTARDIHPPGYYLLLHLWGALTQPTPAHGLEFLYSWVSVAMGILLLPLLYAIARRLFDSSVALLAVWLAAINPFHVWYSQEARMYTLGAALGLLCLWATLRWFEERLPTRRQMLWLWLVVYALAAAVGLYSLYYFAFLWAALNAIAFLLWRRSRRGFTGWLFAQLGVVLLYLPWLPVLWRQATDPPVPPWRVAWRSAGEAGAALAESLSALIAGQSPPLRLYLPWALLAVVIIALYCTFWLRHVRTYSTAGSYPIPMLYVFVPIALIYLATWLVTPLYHARYLFTYAPLFSVIAAVAVAGLAQRRHWLAALLGAALVAMSLASLRGYWVDPLYRPDDHRAATARLAAAWRPGDVILVNAGWSYPILEVYWPREFVERQSALPPDIAQRVRLLDVATGQIEPTAETAQRAPQVIVVRSGSVEGDDSLGWGDPASDFFAISAAETITGLARLASAYDRLWHYRLYDTVSDPTGVIRNWLAEHGRLLIDEAIPGRDFARLQLFALERPDRVNETEGLVSDPLATFGDSLHLMGVYAPQNVAPGTMLYAHLSWQALPALRNQQAPLSMSLRLYDSNGSLLAQADAPPDIPTDQWQPGQQVVQVLALGVPAAATPGEYTLELVVYRQTDGAPLPLPDAPQTIWGQRRILQRIQVGAQE